MKVYDHSGGREDGTEYHVVFPNTLEVPEFGGWSFDTYLLDPVGGDTGMRFVFVRSSETNANRGRVRKERGSRIVATVNSTACEELIENRSLNIMHGPKGRNLLRLEIKV